MPATTPTARRRPLLGLLLAVAILLAVEGLTRLLSGPQIVWLNAYHARVLAELAPLVSPECRVWLETACAPIEGPEQQQ